ncbi:LysM peptidoglycan-binding domain-containing protein [Streptomyces hypolithicus]
MPSKGKHHRSRFSPLARGLVAVSAGSAVLALPILGSATAQAAEPAAAQKAAATYSVVAGDSLSKIAEKRSLTGGWKQLYKDNRKVVGDDPALIHPGLKLTIGAKAPAKAPAKPKAKAPAKAATPAKADADRASTSARADRSERPQQAATYTNDLDGWIKESLAIMAERGIPGTYEGIHRNIIRESGGNPLAINNWDVNAAAGTPSKGLLQVIKPTFDAYWVPGTSKDSYDPVANITAACNYAADRYGSIDNVNGPY